VTGFEGQIPGGVKPRDESPGEAAIRLASWGSLVLSIFGVRLYPFEVEALAKVAGGLLRRWPDLAKLGVLEK
jgi:hypothetical protein